jgi:CHAD domain-containing protein
MATARQDSIRKALIQAWTAQLDDLHRHLPGAQAGADSEELHQFRVAMRKTRALLKLFRKTLPQAARLEAEFKWLAAATGPVRDLDVLMADAQHSATAFDVTAAHVTPVIEALRIERATARKKLGALLRSHRTHDLLESWRQFLAALPARTDLAPAIDIPAWTAINPLIIQQSRRMLQKGLAIAADTDPHAIHELRIRGKRLRYLLESFDRSTYRKRVKSLRRKLRRLQTSLGAHQDAVVAAQRWRQLVDKLSKRNDISSDTIALLAHWETAERDRQCKCRAELPDALKKLAVACGYL